MTNLMIVWARNCGCGRGRGSECECGCGCVGVCANVFFACECVRCTFSPVRGLIVSKSSSSITAFMNASEDKVR